MDSTTIPPHPFELNDLERAGLRHNMYAARRIPRAVLQHSGAVHTGVDSGDIR